MAKKSGKELKPHHVGVFTGRGGKLPWRTKVLTPWWVFSFPATGLPASEVSMAQKIKIGFVALLFIIMLWLAIPQLLDFHGQPASVHPSAVSNTPAHSNAEVYATAEAILQKYLKAPSTAKFAPMSDVKFEKYSDGYRVDSYVDAQNSFGAMIRSSWIVTMREGADNFGEPVLVVLDNEVLYKAATK